MNFESLINYVAVGDSITRAASTNFISYANLINTVSPGLHRGLATNLGVSGGTITTLTTNATTTDTYLQSGQRRNILSCLVGVNDKVIVGTSSATFLTNLASYLDARRSAGWKIVLATLLPDTEGIAIAGGYEAWRQTVNTEIRTWVGVHCDAICDFAADTTMGDETDSNDLTYYQSDKVHPTEAGQLYLAPIMARAIASLAM